MYSTSTMNILTLGASMLASMAILSSNPVSASALPYPPPWVGGGGGGGHGGWRPWAGSAPPAATTTASPGPAPTPAPNPNCLTDEDAATIVAGFVNMLENTQENFNVTLAETMLADDFTDYSDSINYLKQSPLGSVSFESKQAFIEGQGTQPPFPSVDTLYTFHTCDAIAWRWQGNYEPLPIRGINMFLVNEKKQVKTIYVEMNSGAFLKNVGKPECSPEVEYYQ